MGTDVPIVNFHLKSWGGFLPLKLRFVLLRRKRVEKRKTMRDSLQQKRRITTNQEKKSSRILLLSWTDLTFNENFTKPSSKDIVKIKSQNLKPTMNKIHTN